MSETRVYIGGLRCGVREKDLEKFLSDYGRIKYIILKNGFAFVDFEDYRDARDACFELNGRGLLGDRVVVEPAHGFDRSADRFRRERFGYRCRGQSRFDYGPPRRTDYSLTVENLSSRVSWQDLKDYLRQAGEVTFADAHKQHRNEGVVDFATHLDMRTAISKMDGTELKGRRIRLIEARRTSRRHTRTPSNRSRSYSPHSRRSRLYRSRSKSLKSKSPAAKSMSSSNSRSDRSRSKSLKIKSPAAEPMSSSRFRSDRSRSKSLKSKSPAAKPMSSSNSRSEDTSSTSSKEASAKARSGSRSKAPNQSGAVDMDRPDFTRLSSG